MLEMGRELADRLRALRVARVSTRSRMARRCGPRQRPADRTGAGRSVARRRQDFAEQAQRPLALQEVDGCDEPGEVRPRVHVKPTRATQGLHQPRCRRCGIRGRTCPASARAIESAARTGRRRATVRARWRRKSSWIDKPGLDGLAEPDVIGDEQTHSRHLDGPRDVGRAGSPRSRCRSETALAGCWCRSCETAPQRTAFRRASSFAGSSRPVGSGIDARSRTRVPGSSSQTTRSSSPRPSSSTEESDTKCCMLGRENPGSRRRRRSL